MAYRFGRRDPWWEDGINARRRRRRQQAVAFVAFVLSCSALAGTAAAWAMELGVTRSLGLT
jgi:hypothetical protein